MTKEAEEATKKLLESWTKKNYTTLKDLSQKTEIPMSQIIPLVTLRHIIFIRKQLNNIHWHLEPKKKEVKKHG